MAEDADGTGTGSLPAGMAATGARARGDEAGQRARPGGPPAGPMRERTGKGPHAALPEASATERCAHTDCTHKQKSKKRVAVRRHSVGMRRTSRVANLERVMVFESQHGFWLR